MNQINASRLVDGLDIGIPGVTVRTVRAVKPENTYSVFSTPYPMHRATVYRAKDDIWRLYMETRLYSSEQRRTFSDALIRAGALVGALYRIDWNSKYTNLQRDAIKKRACPWMFKGTVCHGSAVPGSVWCDDHRERNELFVPRAEVANWEPRTISVSM